MARKNEPGIKIPKSPSIIEVGGKSDGPVIENRFDRNLNLDREGISYVAKDKTDIWKIANSSSWDCLCNFSVHWRHEMAGELLINLLTTGF